MTPRLLVLALAAACARPAPSSPSSPTAREALHGDVQVTLPPGATLVEVAALLEGAGVVAAEELVRRGIAQDFLAEHTIEGDSVEGLLRPGSYSFARQSTADEVLTAIIERHRADWARLVAADPDGYARAKQLLGGDRAILILASIVEREAPRADEQARVAQLFMNRLMDPGFTPHRLETDATVRYGCAAPTGRSAACVDWDPADRLRRKHLQDADNRYNTYAHEGLPPGPIGSPGDGALRAVLAPDGSDVLYMVGTDDGSHLFARTMSEHQRNVATTLQR